MLLQQEPNLHESALSRDMILGRFEFAAVGMNDQFSRGAAA
ncbi:hypothetical protein [Litoreibacter ascidiaceicola]|nr:hypothetical protein [Litoreibacter ascidiaceicola]